MDRKCTQSESAGARVGLCVCAKLQTTTCPLTKKADRRTQNMTCVFYEAHFHKIVFYSNQIVSQQIRNTTIFPTLSVLYNML